MPATETLLRVLPGLEAFVRENKVNCFYYYVPWLLAQAQDPETKFDFEKESGAVTVEYQGYKRLYYIPFFPHRASLNEILFDYPNRTLEGWTKHKVDVNYINDPKKIVQHKGEDFHEFRHALNVYEKTLANKVVKYEYPKNLEEVYLFLRPLCDRDELRTIGSFLYQQGVDVKVLKVDGEIYSVNMWGDLYKGVIVYLVNKNMPGVPFLSDYSRLQFYDDIKDECEEVNDGSDLGLDGLRRFKRKFNPIRVEDIHSLVRV
jgi:hypothetical protein